MFRQISELTVLGMHPAIPHPRRSQIRPLNGRDQLVRRTLPGAPSILRHDHGICRASSTRGTNSARYPPAPSPLNPRARAAAEAKVALPACFDLRSTIPNSATADAKPMFAVIGCGRELITAETSRLVSPSGAL